MAIAIKDNTTALEALKIKAQSLPNKSDSSGGGTTTNGYDTSNADASPSDVLSPRIFYNAEGEQTGTMVNKGSLSQTITSNGTQSYDAGYYSGGTITVNVPTGSGSTSTVPVATPTININTSGQITATVNQSAGTTSGGTRTATAWLSDDYDADFVSSNIKSGVTIFGVQGTYTGASTDFTQVTAEASEVKEGEYFYNSSGNLEEGTMPNANIDFYGVIQDQDNRAVVYANVDVSGYVEKGTMPIGDMVVLESGQYTLDITSEGTFSITTENKFMLDNIRVTVDAGDDFSEENIVEGKTILGKTGTYTSSVLTENVQTSNAVEEMDYYGNSYKTVVIKTSTPVMEVSSVDKFRVFELMYNGLADQFIIRGYNQYSGDTVGIAGESYRPGSLQKDLLASYDSSTEKTTLSGTIDVTYTTNINGFEISTVTLTLEFKGDYSIYVI